MVINYLNTKKLTMENSELKLIYINKVGYTSKGEGLYEFIFQKMKRM